jgi:hypothetical protein
MSRIPWWARRKKPGPKPGSPSALRCGAVNRQRYERSHWVRLGQLGGTVNAMIHGPEGLARAGRKGGLATLAAYGPEHFAALGRRSAQIRAAKRRHLLQQQRW